MSEMARWNGHKFEVSGSVLRSFTDLTLKGGSETETKTTSKQGYTSRKSGSPIEISLTAELYAMFGCDVRAEAVKFVEEARAGSSDYFYVAGKKLMACKMMLTSADVSDVELTAAGKWVRASVKLTMKQCSKNDGSAVPASSSSSSSSSRSGSSGGGSSSSKSKVSAKTSSTKSKSGKTSKQAAKSVIAELSTYVKQTSLKIKAKVNDVKTTPSSKAIASKVKALTKTERIVK